MLLLSLKDEVTYPSLTVFKPCQVSKISCEYPYLLNEYVYDDQLEYGFDYGELKQCIGDLTDTSLSILTRSAEQNTFILFSNINDFNDWVNVDKSDPEVKNFKRYFGSIKRASTLYKWQVDRHSSFQDGEADLPISEKELEKRLAKSKTNLIRRNGELLEKQSSILSRNPNGSIPNPSELYDWDNDGFDRKWDSNNENNN